MLLYDEATCWPTTAPASGIPLSGLLAALGAVQRGGPRVRIVLCGLPTLSLNLKRARTYAERMFRHVVIGNLPPTRPARPWPFRCRQRAQLRLARIDRPHRRGDRRLPVFPPVLRRLRLQPDRPRAIRARRLPADRVRLLHELDLAFFEDRFEVTGANRAGAAAADGPAGGRRRSPGSPTRRAHRRVNVAVGLRRLIDKGLVYPPDPRTYDFALPLFGGYLERRSKGNRLIREHDNARREASRDQASSRSARRARARRCPRDAPDRGRRSSGNQPRRRVPARAFRAGSRASRSARPGGCSGADFDAYVDGRRAEAERRYPRSRDES